MSVAVFEHIQVPGKHFERPRIVLDGMWFEDCSFKNCEIFYSGGPAEIRSCRFENIRWHLQGAAALTVETIQKLGWTVKPLEFEQCN